MDSTQKRTARTDFELSVNFLFLSRKIEERKVVFWQSARTARSRPESYTKKKKMARSGGGGATSPLNFPFFYTFGQQQQQHHHAK
jgi:hypothetical protein